MLCGACVLPSGMPAALADMAGLTGAGLEGHYAEDDLEDDEEFFPEDEVDPDNMTYEVRLRELYVVCASSAATPTVAEHNRSKVRCAPARHLIAVMCVCEAASYLMCCQSLVSRGSRAPVHNAA